MGGGELTPLFLLEKIRAPEDRRIKKCGGVQEAPTPGPGGDTFGALVLCIKLTSTPRPPRHQVEMRTKYESALRQTHKGYNL